MPLVPERPISKGEVLHNIRLSESIKIKQQRNNHTGRSRRPNKQREAIRNFYIARQNQEQLGRELRDKLREGSDL